MRFFAVVLLYLLFVHGKVDDERLSSILGELIDLRTELNDLFKSPTKQYGDQQPDAEWVVHLDRGISEAKWLANLTNTIFVGPVIFKNLMLTYL